MSMFGGSPTVVLGEQSGRLSVRWPDARPGADTN